MTFDSQAPLRSLHSGRLRSGRRALSRGGPCRRWPSRQGLEEIVVTAQRRETSLQTTPIAISAYTGDKLAEDKIFTRRRPRQQRACVLVHGGHAARPRTEHPRHHQHAPRLADVRSVGRHVRRRRLHRPHRRLQLRLLRPRAHRSHPRPAGRAARQERRRWRAERHHGGAGLRQLRARHCSRTATTTRCSLPAT